MPPRYTYTGDNTGTNLRNGITYTFVKVNPNIYRAYESDSGGFVEVTKDELEYYKEMGVLQE